MIFQVGAALLDACVLSTLRHGDTYGYVLTQTLMGTLEISESTLYPVLRRLQKDEFLSTYDSPHMGRNRRYYKITDKGMARSNVYRVGWQEYKERVDSLILSDIAPGGVNTGMGAGESASDEKGGRRS
ncbi:MAG: PadR family transcriptional regulator [Clostridiales Family XIII bacterium]|jgi:PadR family transcriptional regulator PadR|nr:PadR family transcriptional regulator [Clostridiales Family XIII bacterium]